MTRSLLLLAWVAVLCACPRPRPPAPGEDGGIAQPADSGQHDACVGDGLLRCAGQCVNVATDPRHCGFCQVDCAQDALCVGGTCSCPDDRRHCGQRCADLQTDPDHCGQCGGACAENEECVAGLCAPRCGSGQTRCTSGCSDLDADNFNCGACGNACPPERPCQGGACRCPAGTDACADACLELQTDPFNCGACGARCFAGYDCSAGVCTCPAPLTSCGIACVDILSDPSNCGACSVFCQPGQTCTHGACVTPCPAGYALCGTDCVDLKVDATHCGACGNSCAPLSCQSGQCVSCGGPSADCDNDGWTPGEGDCCDVPGACSPLSPSRVNPGALELTNGVDDNCNGLLDSADVEDTLPCDLGLASGSADPFDYARALGLCRTTVESAPRPQRTWGVIDARLLTANGGPLSFAGARSIRSWFGKGLEPKEGRSLVVLSSGIASDGTQRNPGPNGGPLSTSIPHASTSVDIQSCTAPYCIQDWFAAANLPLKLANQLPAAPGCAAGTLGVNAANDSVMLVLRLRAPTNARAFRFHAYFFSSEYPEYVCSLYNDQLIALVDTPGGPPVGALNPPDKNLMTYVHAGKHWPVGINVAKGTGLFRVCQTQAQNPACWDGDVSPLSCSQGAGPLQGTGFEAPTATGCTHGGGTGWLVTSGNIRPGEIVELRVALWDVGDHILDSLAVLDAFQWLEAPVTSGTTD